MRCPKCGHWNRASFPRCFRCGAPLEPEIQETERPAQQPDAAKPSGKIYIQIDEEGRATSSVDERDKLAAEMKDLLLRKERGEQEQQRLRRDSARQGIAPSGRSVQTMTGRAYFPTGQSTSYITDDEEIEGDVRPDAIPVISPRGEETDDFYAQPTGRAPRVSGMTMRQMKAARHFGLRRFTRFFAFVLLAACVAFAGYQFLYKPLVLDKQEPPLQERAIITPSILDDMPAHTIRLPAQEGASIYIKELKKSYTVAGGYATLEIPDYIWYEDSESVTQEFVTATLTPYIKTSAGEQKPMDLVHYDVEIPLSPLTLVTPDTGYAKVSTALYNIQFMVEKNSTVYINGENYSDLVNTQDGLISYNASVSPIGENNFTIVARSQYYRENSVTVTLYREPQQIRLDLAADIASRWSPGLVDDTSKAPDAKGKYPQKEEPMTIRCTTVSWANITIKSPYANLDTTQLALNGSFSFEAVFDKIGTNKIIIEASAPGYETSVVEHDVYYVPIAAIYTRKAWDMDKEYIDFLNNAERRIANTQIYVCYGEITQILSEKPQLAIMKLDSTQERTVLIENLSNDTWKVGSKGRVYADAFGTYDGMPRLVVRYTYFD